MITKKMVIEFHEQRLKSTVKIIETLRELKKTNLTTHLIDCEIEMQEGERDFTNETLIFLKQEDTDDELISCKSECGRIEGLFKRSSKINFLDTHNPHA